MENRRKGADTIAAQSDLPWLGVHALTEFIYCPRAGLIEFEKDTDDEGGDEQGEPWANLNFRPLYDVQTIDDQINRQSWRMLIWGVTAVLLSIAAYLSYFRLGLPWLLVALGAYLTCWRLVSCLLNVAKLLWLRKLALTAPGREADPNQSEDQRVNWWELLRAGFDPTTPTGAFESPELRLAGRPWRVLVRGSTQIPVFKKRHCTGANGHRLYNQHRARIAAYCRVIDEAVGAQSPYGIVLFDDCYEGIAINASKVGATGLLIESLVDARTVIQNSLGNIAPDPAPPTTCGQTARSAGHGHTVLANPRRFVAASPFPSSPPVVRIGGNITVRAGIAFAGCRLISG